MKQFAPVYLIDGEEPYYLDKITHYFEYEIIPQSERDFNLIVLYAKDVEWKDVINACRRFPMFAERQVVILKDAGQMTLKNFNELARYIEKPMPTTIFLIEHRFKKADGRGKVPPAVKKRGIYFTSEKLKDERDVQKWIQGYGDELQFKIGDAEAELLSIHLGNDLQKITNEIDKVRINVPNEKHLTKELIYRYIGISKEYNVLEFPDALINNDRDKLFKMLAYFISNPKSAPMPLLVGLFYNKFNRLYQANFLKGKNDKDIAAAMGISPYIVQRELAPLGKWPLARVERCMFLLGKYSTMAVGINTYATDDGELLKEMVGQMLG